MKLFKKKNKNPNMNKEIDLEELENEGSPKRELIGFEKKLMYFVGLAMALFHIYALAIRPTTTWALYCGHMAFGFTLCFATYRMSKKSGEQKIPLYDWILIIATWLCALYIIVEGDLMQYRVGVNPTNMDVIIGVTLVILVLEITRRTCGNILPSIAIIFLIYAKFGNYVPGLLNHKGYSWSNIFSFMASLDGIFSTPMSASATMVFLFIIFGAFLEKSGSGKFFMDASLGLAGRYRGGPAKVAIISSALFGTVSGNSVANVVSTGSLTIPMMIKTGYKPHFAAAVEATASTGGQIMPPILGSAAFIMSSLIGIPYNRIILAAIIPAVLYFFTVFLMVDLEAVKNNLKGLPKDECPNLKKVLVKDGYLVLPLVVLILTLTVLNLSTIRAALYGIIACVLASLIRKENRMGIKDIFDAMSKGAFNSISVISACGTAGIVIGVLSLTGTGLKFASAIIALARGQLWLALILTMVASIVLGMGLPTTASYLICASILSPALINMGLEPLTAHMFIFYFACISAITPPVALAAYAGASISKSNPLTVAFAACKIGIAAFLVPYAFAYGPELLWNGSVMEILRVAATSITGCLLLCFGIQGNISSTNLNIIQRILLLVASLLLIATETTSDYMGMVIGVIVIAWTWLVNKKRHEETV